MDPFEKFMLAFFAIAILGGGLIAFVGMRKKESGSAASSQIGAMSAAAGISQSPIVGSAVALIETDEENKDEQK